MTKRIVSVGGGIASTLLLPLDVVWNYGIEDTELVMAVLPNEHPDVWRLCDRAEELTGLAITYIAYDPDAPGKWRRVDKTERTSGALWMPMDVFFKEHFLGNSRIDPCSKNLKRQTVARYITANYQPGEAVIYVGIGADEIERFAAIREGWGARGFETAFPLMNWTEMDRERAIQACELLCGFVPELYTKRDVKDPTRPAFAHNNCSGACIKAGQRQWINLLVHFPDVYAEWELGETIFRARFGDYSILKRERDGENSPLTLYALRKQFELEQRQRAGDVSDLPMFAWLNSTPACSFCDAAVPEFCEVA